MTHLVLGGFELRTGTPKEHREVEGVDGDIVVHAPPHVLLVHHQKRLLTGNLQPCLQLAIPDGFASRRMWGP